MSKPSPIRRIFSAADLFVFYLKELLFSNVRVAHDILTPDHDMKPELVYVDVRGLNDMQLMATAHLITMAPGTLSINIDDDRHELVIHDMYCEDVEAAALEIKNQYIRRICNVF